jgi:hypothetical protein
MTVTDGVGPRGVYQAWPTGPLERVWALDGHPGIDGPPGGPITIAIDSPGHA